MEKENNVTIKSLGIHLTLHAVKLLIKIEKIKTGIISTTVSSNPFTKIISYYKLANIIDEIDIITELVSLVWQIGHNVLIISGNIIHINAKKKIVKTGLTSMQIKMVNIKPDELVLHVCGRIMDELISDNFQCNRTRSHFSVKRPAKSRIKQFGAETVYRLENLKIPRLTAMEIYIRVKKIFVVSSPW